MASRSTNTMQEWMQGLMREIADAKSLSDADLPWLVQLESMVIERMKRPVQELVASGQLPAGPPPQQFGSPAGSMQGGGLMAGTQMPPMGEIDRLLGAGAPGL